MALSSDPHRSSIKNEFGSSTLNASVNNGSLSDMYGLVFGGSNFSRDAFGGKAKATVSGNMSVGVSTNTVTLTVSMTAGGVNTELIGQYQSVFDGSGNEKVTPDSGGWTTFVSTTTSTDGSVDLQGTVPDGKYFFRVQVYNGFISHTSDRLYVNTGDDTDRFEVDYTPVSDISNLTLIYADGVDDFKHYWTYPATSGTFTVEESVNSGGYNSSTVNNLTYEGNVYGLSNVWSANFQPSQLLSSGDDVIFRIRRSGTTDQWVFTQLFDGGVEEIGDLAIPSITTLSATNIGTTMATLRMDVTSFDGVQQSYDYYWQYRIDGSGTWTNTFINTASNEAEKTIGISGLDDDTTYEFRAVAQNEHGGTLVEGSILQFTTNEAQLDNFPTNFTAVDNRPFNGVDLTWNHPQSGAPDTYNIQWFNGSNWNSEIIGLNGSNTSYTDSNAGSTVTKYRIQAIDGGVASAWVESNTI